MKSNIGSIVFEEYASEIRLSDDGRISVFDLIKVVGGQKNPRDVWKRLCTQDNSDYSEVVGFCDYLQFPGAGQRPTPVISKKGALILLGLLPGEVGSKYREEAAVLMLAYLEAPEELARLAIEKIDDAAKLAGVISLAQQKYITKYHPLFDEIRDRLCVTHKEDGEKVVSLKSKQTFMSLNTLNTTTILGKNPKDIVSERGGENARSHLQVAEYNRYGMLQDAQSEALNRRPEAERSSEIYAVCKSTADKFTDFFNSL